MLTVFLFSMAFISDDFISSFTSFLIIASFLFISSGLSLLSLKASPSPWNFLKQKPSAYVWRLKLSASPYLAAPAVYFSFGLLSVFFSLFHFVIYVCRAHTGSSVVITIPPPGLFVEECCKESIKSRQPGLSTTQVS